MRVMRTGQLMEAVMLICFGLAWPASVYKSYTSRSTKGKSFSFMFILLIGYAAGICHVFVDNPGFCYLVLLYILNIFMIVLDMLLFFRNRKIEASMAQCR